MLMLLTALCVVAACKMKAQSQCCSNAGVEHTYVGNNFNCAVKKISVLLWFDVCDWCLFLLEFLFWRTAELLGAQSRGVEGWFLCGKCYRSVCAGGFMAIAWEPWPRIFVSLVLLCESWEGQCYLQGKHCSWKHQKHQLKNPRDFLLNKLLTMPTVVSQQGPLGTSAGSRGGGVAVLFSMDEL